ncbi:MAG: XRE family transcriptional regulator [Alphaproteobacteria bacterium]|nr:XRE family transcriptional regulator [Alphaproteobacteria bacterium]
MSIGQRIRVSRRAAGLSLRDLEARIDNRVSAQAISKYERDESMPSSGVLIVLANALDVSVDYLASDSEIALEAVDFRRKRLTSKREEAQVEAKVLDLLERYLTVEEILCLPTVARDMPRDAPWPVLHDVAEAEQAALGLRGHWGLGLDPIPNLVELLEERGVKVLSMSLTNIDGLTARVRREDRSIASVIVVNRRDSGERQRFTVAHELGHMFLDVPQKLDDEKAAHRFAGAFLIPAETLRAEIGKHRKSIGWSELFDLKQIFGVSVQALTYRCKDLGIFANPLFRRLFNEFNRRGWRSPPYREPWAMKGEEPKRFERLCFRALAEGAISESRAAELLGHSVHELIQLMDEPPGMEAASASP